MGGCVDPTGRPIDLTPRVLESLDLHALIQISVSVSGTSSAATPAPGARNRNVSGNNGL